MQARRQNRVDRQTPDRDGRVVWLGVKQGRTCFRKCSRSSSKIFHRIGTSVRCSQTFIPIIFFISWFGCHTLFYSLENCIYIYINIYAYMQDLYTYIHENKDKSSYTSFITHPLPPPSCDLRFLQEDLVLLWILLILIVIGLYHSILSINVSITTDSDPSIFVFFFFFFTLRSLVHNTCESLFTLRIKVMLRIDPFHDILRVIAFANL